jgi:hypothetical protein
MAADQVFVLCLVIVCVLVIGTAELKSRRRAGPPSVPVTVAERKGGEDND